MALQGDGDAVLNQGCEFEQASALVVARAQLTGLEDLLYGGEQAVRVGEHDFVEVLALSFRDVAALQGFEVESYGGDGRFEFVSDGVEKGILALVAADLADQEDGVEDDAGGEHGEEDGAEDDGGDAAFVEDDPGNVVGDKTADQKRTKGDREGDATASSGDVHGVQMSIDAWGVERWIDES